jgi:hypothetical protein
MPVLTVARRTSEQAPPKLIDARGQPTLEAQVISGFLVDCDWSPVFEHQALKPYMTKIRVAVKEDNGKLVPAIANAPGAFVMDVQALDGKIAVEAVDARDLEALFKHYLNREYPRESLANKLALDQFSYLLENKPFDRAALPKDHMAMIAEMIGQSMLTKPMNKSPNMKPMTPMMGKVGTTLKAPVMPPTKPSMATESIKVVRCSEAIDPVKLEAAKKTLPVVESQVSMFTGPRRSAAIVRSINEGRDGGISPVNRNRKMIAEGLRNGTLDLKLKEAHRQAGA